MDQSLPNFRRAFKRHLTKVTKRRRRLEALKRRIAARYPQQRTSSESVNDLSDSTDSHEDLLDGEHEVEMRIEAAKELEVSGEEELVDNSEEESDNISGILDDSDSSTSNEEHQVSSNEENEAASDQEYENPQVFEFANEEEKSAYVQQSLQEWASKGGNVSMKKVDDLLKYLRVVFPTLPKSYKTLLKTPTELDIVQFPDGSSMWYKGICTNLNAMLLDEYLEKYGGVQLDVNMDGLPLSKSSKIKFFPIIGYLVKSRNKPFVIAIYFGEWDPIDTHSFLYHYVNELRELLGNGYVRNGVRYPFNIRNYILDAPARSLVKCCVGHGGYGACEKCTDPGETVSDRRVFLNLDAPLRSDDSFANQADPLHHTGKSSLEDVGTKMVSQFRLDPFHLVWHGVFRRLLAVWNEWNGPWKLSRRGREAISSLLRVVAEFCPSDFCRPPRSFDDWKVYKGTEERRLCLYDGLLVFRDTLPENIYKNYLLLQAALYILTSPVFVQTMCDYAGVLLRNFITHAVEIYGRKFVVYNVHSLSHLPQECSLCGPLDSFSAFIFENFLKSLKQSLKSGYKPLQQAALRDLERTRQVPVQLESVERTVSLSRIHVDAEEEFHGIQYKCVSVDNVVFKCGSKDSCYRSVQGDIYVLKNIVKRGHTIYLIGNKFNRKNDFYDYPLPSSTLGIFKVSALDNERHAIALSSVDAKCWLMPDGNESFLCTPLLHTVPLF